MDNNLAPDGQPWKLPHKSLRSGNCYRIVEEHVHGFRTGEAFHLIANAAGSLFVINKGDFARDFKYQPGGQ